MQAIDVVILLGLLSGAIGRWNGNLEKELGTKLEAYDCTQLASLRPRRMIRPTRLQRSNRNLEVLGFSLRNRGKLGRCVGFSASDRPDRPGLHARHAMNTSVGP
ncbi:hypothetical protein BKA80DRAFT_274203 [Phyllosticta citrichinensis]